MPKLNLSPAVAALNPAVAASLTTSEPAKPRRKRAAPGDGDRQAALGRIAKAGWCCYWYDAATRTHSFTHRDGRRSPLWPSYRAAVDGMLELIDGH